jgi:hypothetical protein
MRENGRELREGGGYARRVSPRARELVLAAGAALVLAALWTWPVAADLGGSLPWDPREGAFRDARTHQGPWALWHAARAVGRLEDPFDAPELGPPHGTSIALEEHALAPALLALPLTACFGAVAAANATRLLLLAAALAACFGLGRAAGLSRRAAALAAAAWSLSPHHLEAGLASIGRGAAPWLPLLWLAVLRLAAGRPGRPGERSRSLRLAVTAGACAAAALLSSPVGGPAALLATAALWLLAPSLDPARTAGARSGALRAGPLLLFGLVLLPFGVPAWTAAVRAEDERARTASAAVISLRGEATAGEVPAGKASLGGATAPARGVPGGAPGVRALDLFAPPALHPLLRRDGVPVLGRAPGSAPGPPAVPLAGPPPGPLPGPSLFPGLAVLVLASCAALYARGARRWLLLGGLLLLATWDPGRLLARSLGSLPAVGRGLGAPGAFFPAAHLALALAAGRGLDSLRGQAGGPALGVVVAVLLPLELLVAPYPTHRVWRPAPVEAIAEWPGDGAVCVLPLAEPVGLHPPPLRMVAVALIWQTVHRRPATFGWVADPDPGAARLWARLAPDLVLLGIGGGTSNADALALDLAHLRTDHVLLRTGAAPDSSAAIAVLDALPGWTRAPLEDGGLLWWYRNAAAPRERLSAIAGDAGTDGSPARPDRGR